MSESPLRSRYVMAGGVRTHYVETGHNGPPVVLCHGGAPGFSGEVGFEQIMPALGAKWDKSQITDELLDRHQESATRPGAPEARRVFLEGMQRLTRDPDLRDQFEMTNRLPSLRIPAMFIWGEEDRFAPAGLGRQLEKLLPGTWCKTISRSWSAG